MVSRDLLEVMLPSYRNISNSTRVINRSIKKLFTNMFLDKVHEKQQLGKGNSPCIVSLDRAGAVLLGVPFRRRIIHNRKIIHGEEYIFRSLPSNYRHIHGVNRCEIDTILICEEVGGEIYEWAHEKPVELHYATEKVVVIPDVVIRLKFNTGQFCAFLEYDTGSEDIRCKEPKTIKEKILKYRKYKSSEIWKNNFSDFPILLFVTEDAERINFFNNKCEENGILGIGIYYKNYKDVLRRMAKLY